MTETFESKTVLITGGAGAIGSATARTFLQRGANVVLVDLDAKGLEQVSAGLSAPDRIKTVAGDVSDPEVMKGAVATAVKAFGALDVAFNNAGISGEVAPVERHGTAVEQQHRRARLADHGLGRCRGARRPSRTAASRGAGNRPSAASGPASRCGIGTGRARRVRPVRR